MKSTRIAYRPSFEWNEHIEEEQATIQAKKEELELELEQIRTRRSKEIETLQHEQEQLNEILESLESLKSKLSDLDKEWFQVVFKIAKNKFPENKEHNSELIDC